jgi:hypothetical protein
MLVSPIAYKLRDMEDPNALDVLTEIVGMRNFDGGDSLTIKEAIKTRKNRSERK